VVKRDVAVFCYYQQGTTITNITSTTITLLILEYTTIVLLQKTNNSECKAANKKLPTETVNKIMTQNT